MSEPYGMRISEEGKDIQSTNLDDISFDSRYHSLMLLKKHTFTFTAEGGDTLPSGQVVYAHGLGYAPFTLGYVSYTSNENFYGSLPHSATSTLGSLGAKFGVYVALAIDDTNLTVNWEANQYVGGTPEPLSSDVVFTVTLHIYSLKLGFKT